MPTNVRAYESLGQIQENLGQADEATKTYAAGAERNRINKNSLGIVAANRSRRCDAEGG